MQGKGDAWPDSNASGHKGQERSAPLCNEYRYVCMWGVAYSNDIAVLLHSELVVPGNAAGQR